MNVFIIVMETNEVNTQTNKSKMNWWKFAVYAIVILGLFAGGFFLGRRTIKPGKPDIVYVPGDSVSVEVPYPVPVYVSKPVDTLNVLLAIIKSGKYYELFPEKVRDSIVYVTPQDTSDVIRDWASERFYEEKVFDIDTVGSATVRAKTQYNRITFLGTTFKPVTKVVTEYKPVNKYSPFVGVGLTTMPTVAGQAGMFFEDKYGFSGLYQYDWQNKNHIFGAMFLLKF